MKEGKKFRKTRLVSLAVLLVVGGYAAYSTILIAYQGLRYGAIDAWDYPAYAVPYIPVFLALLAVWLFMPWILGLRRVFQLPVVNLVSLAVAIPSEHLLENVPVYDSIYGLQDIQSWQALSCVATVQARQTVSSLAFGERSFAVKAHFYLIALVLLLVGAYLLWRYNAMAYTGEKGNKAALLVQTLCYAAFLALCIFACFTAFFRTGDLKVSRVSAVLMTLFFVCIGVTAGLYTGGLLNGKGHLLSIGLPVFTSLLTTGAMYAGELLLLGGELFQLGEGPLFYPMAGTPFALADIAVILASGACVLLLLLWLKKQPV